MGYIKISDPNIIDLNAIHNIINVVNQHSDTLNTLTNNYGADDTAAVNYSKEQTAHIFGPSSQMIIYGRDVVDATAANQATTSTAASGAGRVYHKTINFKDNGGSAFTTANPLIFITLHSGNTTVGGVNQNFSNAIGSIYNITSSTFDIRIFLPGSEVIGPTQKIYVNWMAIGPKGK